MRDNFMNTIYVYEIECLYMKKLSLQFFDNLKFRNLIFFYLQKYQFKIKYTLKKISWTDIL